MKKPQANNSTGYVGVYKNKRTEKYMAYLTVNGETYFKYGFDTAEDAYYKGRLVLEKEHISKKERQKIRTKQEIENCDLTGMYFGSLTVISKSNKTDARGNKYWMCICECGNKIAVRELFLLSGRTKSCGCSRIKNAEKMREIRNKKQKIDDVIVPTLKRKRNVNNQTGVKGVSIVKTAKGVKYRADITIRGKMKYLGLFDTIEEASAARKNAEEIYHKPFLKKLEEKQHDE